VKTSGLIPDRKASMPGSRSNPPGTVSMPTSFPKKKKKERKRIQTVRKEI
jgi:hypothetical protein